nr:1,4-beta-xylanase [Cytophagales bacterium]
MPQEPGLKAIFNGNVYIGVALGTGKVRSADPELLSVLGRHFNSISPENLLKWESVHPRLGEFHFRDADDYVALGEKLGHFVVGHTLVWHNQTPEWVFQEPDGSLLPKEALLARMEAHIEQVMGRYKGRIHGWDVVNEAFTDEGEFRNSRWFSIAGADFIKHAFLKAHMVDPSAELYYNDYNLWKPSKIDAVVAFAKKLRAEGVQIDGIGMQGHYGLTSPTIQEIELSINKINQAGFKVMITELDIDVLPKPTPRQGAEVNDRFGYDRANDPYTEGLPAEINEKLADRYAALFRLFGRHQDKISRVTLWGVRDQDSWLNNWPIRGRTAYPLLFDQDYKLKEFIYDRIKGAAGEFQ